AVTVVARSFLVGHLFGAHLIEALSAAEAREGMALGNQFIRVLLINFTPFALTIRTVRAAHIRAFIPFDTEPAQRIIDLLFRLPRRAQLVGVLNAQDELTAMLTGETQVEQRDIRGADVRIASRRRRDTGTNGGH